MYILDPNVASNQSLTYRSHIFHVRPMILDYRINKVMHEALTVKEENVEIVDKYKYLGVYIHVDDALPSQKILITGIRNVSRVTLSEISQFIES